jgi:TonB family protein
MESQAPLLTLGLLPERRTPWEKFLFSYGVQSAVLTFFLLAALLHPEVLVLPVHDYHFVHLVETPPPVPQTPQPVVRNLPKLTPMAEPRPEALRVPKELVPPKKETPPDVQAPKVEVKNNKPVNLPDSKVVIPKQLVKTNVFSTGSSATPTIAAAPQKVQTGGFGDPNGVPNHDNQGRPVTISQQGSFDLPSGPGYGNGTGGAQGARGVVASAGFGNGIATGDNSGRTSASRVGVHQGGFGDADVVSAATPKPKAVEPVVKTIPAEITYKPRPVYTDEARNLKIEGEVLVKVLFTASGQIRVLGVEKGLGHGLDESAMRAAKQIQFKPALKNGQPADFQAVLHIVFQLA